MSDNEDEYRSDEEHDNGFEFSSYGKSRSGKLFTKRKRERDEEDEDELPVPVRKSSDIIRRDHKKTFDDLVENSDALIQNFFSLNNEGTTESKLLAKLLANGIITSCIRMGCSERTLKSVLKIGQGRYKGVRDNKRASKPGGVNGNAVSSSDLDRMRDNLKTWKLEWGFPCSCRKMKGYFVDQNLTWHLVWEKYRNSGQDSRVLSVESAVTQDYTVQHHTFAVVTQESNTPPSTETFSTVPSKVID